MQDRRSRILELADANDEIFSVVHDAIATNGITAQAYAEVFKYLGFDARRPGSQLIYVQAKKLWRCGTKNMTDIGVLSALGVTCQIVREYIRLSWEECVFSAWLPQRELQNFEDAMDSMESMDKLKDILELAGPLMKPKPVDPAPAKQQPGKEDMSIDWDDLGKA